MKKTAREELLEKELAAVRRVSARLREGPGPNSGIDGCGDHSCVVRPPSGMGTNGGCHCDERTLRRMIGWQRAEIARLRASFDLTHEVVAEAIGRARVLLPPADRTPEEARKAVFSILCEVVGQVEAVQLVGPALSTCPACLAAQRAGFFHCERHSS